VTGGPQRLPEDVRHRVEVVRVGVGVGLREVEVSHVVDRHHVQVGVGNLEAGDHQPHPGGGEGRLLGVADSVCHLRAMGRHVGREVGPAVDLGHGNDEDVAPVEGPDVDHGDTQVVTPDDPAGDLPLDDAGEDGGHRGSRRRSLGECPS
jgi:hypothetical protein